MTERRWIPADQLLGEHAAAEAEYMARFGAYAGLVCPGCGDEFGHEDSLTRHRIRVHGGITKRLTELPHPKRLAELLAAGRGIVATYSSLGEREELRQAMYRAARRAGVRVSVITDGGESGTLHAMPTVSGRCLERRGEPRPPIRTYQLPSEEGDLAAVRELQQAVRAAAAKLIAEGVRPRQT